MTRYPLALLLALAPLVATAADPKIPDLAVESYTLPNGLKVALHRDPAAPRVTVCVAYHVGSKDERAGRTGFAHFFEHMMFRGTKNVPNYDIPLQEAGASSNAFTTEDMTVYFETVPSNFLERALFLEAERLAFLPSALVEEKFATEREVVKNERRQSYENVPYGLAEETLLAKVFPQSHPYSWSVIGSMKDLNGSTTDDLKRFFADFYHPGNATLCLVGDFEIKEAKALISKYFGPLAAGPARPAVAPRPSKTPAVRVEQADEVQLPRVYWAWATVADDHPDAPALDLLATILAGGDASRLHRALVLDRGLAKDVSADSDTKEIAGMFTLDATAAEGKTVAEIEPVFAEEVARIRREAPSDKELARAQAKFEKATFSALTPPLGRAITLSAGFAQHDDPAYYRKDFARYFKVTPQDITRVAKTYLSPEKVALVIRPAKPDEEKTPAIELTVPKAGGVEKAGGIAARAPKGGPDWSKLPGPGEAHPFEAPKVVRTTLSTGLRVWVAPWHTLPIVNARVLMPGGSADDPEGKAGLATLTATMLDKGHGEADMGAGILSATELAEALEELGVTPSAHATADTTTLGFSAVTHNLEPALALIAPLLARPLFAAEDVDRERQLQLADLLQGPDQPSWIAQRAFRALLFGPDHPYGRPADGSPESVKGLTAKDIRAFRNAHFLPRGSTLIVVGDVEPDALVKALEATFGQWNGGAREAEPRAIPKPEAEVEPGVAFLADKPGAVQSILSVGRRWVDRDDPRYFATMVGNRVLGSDFLSRLNQNLREKNGYSYGAGSSFHYRRVGSVWGVNTSVRADATAPALKEVLAELDDVRRERPLTDEEISVARDAEARSYPETFEDPSGIAGLLAEMALHGLPDDYPDTYLDRLAATKPDEVRAVMAELVDPKSRTILIVGDREGVEPTLKALKFKEVRVIDPDGKAVGR